MTEGTKGRSFDALAKGLASGDVSRGKALKLMGAALFGGAFASIPGAALAQSSGGGGRPTGSRGCPIPGQIRVKGQCVCPSGTTLCGNECVDNNVCPGEYILTNGCSCECPSGTRDCRGDFSCVSDQCAYNEVFNGNTCQCEALTSPSLLRCFCQDGTQIDTCTPVNCDSGPAQDVVCGPLCESHGGEAATACFFDDPSCVGQA